MHITPRLFACFIPIVLAACGNNQEHAPQTAVTAAHAAAMPGAPAAPAYHDVIERFYLAYFGRPADVSGLDYWARQYQLRNFPTSVGGFSDAYASDADIKTFVDVFGTSQESRALYPGDNGAFLDAVYRNLFNRLPDAVGKAFWLDKLERGMMTRPIAAFKIMQGAQSTDIEIIERKVAVAAAFTRALDTDIERDAYDGLAASASARAMLASVGLATDVQSFDGIASTLAELLGRLGPRQQYLEFNHGAGSSLQRAMLPATGGAAIDMAPPGDKLVEQRLFSAPLADGMAASVRQDSLVFWGMDRLYRQALAGHGNVPRATVVSTLNRSDTCYVGSAFADLVAPVRSVIVYRLPGADAQCRSADDRFAAVRMDMSNTAPPLVVKETLFALYATNGAISGYMVKDHLAIQRVDADFANPVTMFSVTPEFTGGTVPVPIRQVGNFFVFRNNDSAYVWDAQRAPAGAPVGLDYRGDTYDRLVDAIGVDSEQLYLITRAADKVYLKRYRADTGALEGLSELPVPGQTGVTLNVTASAVVVGDKATGSLWVVPRAGGLARKVHAGSGQSESVVEVNVAGERIWISTPQGVTSVKTDGSEKIAWPGARRAGCVYQAAVQFRTQEHGCASMLLLDDELRGYNALSGEQEVRYGIVPQSHSPLYFGNDVYANTSGGSHGQGMLLTLHATSIVNGLTMVLDHWRFTAGQAGLTKVTMP